LRDGVGHGIAQVAALDAARDVVDVDGAARLSHALLRDLARAVAGCEEDLVAALGVRRLQALEGRRRVHTLLPERALHVVHGTPETPVRLLRARAHLPYSSCDPPRRPGPSAGRAPLSSASGCRDRESRSRVDP